MGMIVLQGKSIEAAGGSTIEEAVSSSGLHPDAYLYLIDGRPVPMDTVMDETTVVKALRVASGG